MKGRFPPEKLTKYPHMSKDEIPIWERFLEEHASNFESFDYDVRVGEGEPPSEALNDKEKAMAKALSQKRIDAVGYTPDTIYLFEVKARAGMSALGQIISYRRLYEMTQQPQLQIKAVIVCERIDADLASIIEENNIEAVLM
tara:strand:- start:1229 stop:1654 length:426 start_codon:yes stop_codon:yes gene_type:complete